jgi:hypothetical protein
VKNLLVLITLCTAGLLARAQIVFTDSFNYPDGLLVGAPGSPWLNNYAPTGEVSVSSGRVFLSQDRDESVRVDFANNYSTGTLYASFTVNFSKLPDGRGNYFCFFRQSGVDNLRARVWATTNQSPAGQMRLGIATLGEWPVVAPFDFSPGQTQFVVVRIVLSNSISTLWINPISEADPSKQAVSTNDIGSVSIGHFGFYQTDKSFQFGTPDSMGQLFFDDLRIGRTFADVVPNPAPPVLYPPGFLGGGAAQLRGIAAPGQSITVQANTNLTTTNWVDLGQTTADPGGVIQFSDADAANHPARFYRVWQP